MASGTYPTQAGQDLRSEMGAEDVALDLRCKPRPNQIPRRGSGAPDRAPDPAKRRENWDSARSPPSTLSQARIHYALSTCICPKKGCKAVRHKGVLIGEHVTLTRVGETETFHDLEHPGSPCALSPQPEAASREETSRPGSNNGPVVLQVPDGFVGQGNVPVAAGPSHEPVQGTRQALYDNPVAGPSSAFSGSLSHPKAKESNIGQRKRVYTEDLLPPGWEKDLVVSSDSDELKTKMDQSNLTAEQKTNIMTYRRARKNGIHAANSTQKKKNRLEEAQKDLNSQKELAEKEAKALAKLKNIVRSYGLNPEELIRKARERLLNSNE